MGEERNGLSKNPPVAFPRHLNEGMDFIDFLLTKPETPKNGLDQAIEELENGEYDTYSNFDDFLSEVEHES